MKFLLLFFFLHAAIAQGIEPVSLECDLGNRTMRINATVALSLVDSGDIFNGIGIVNTTNRQLLPACNFTEEDGYFVFRPDENTFVNCPVEITATDTNVIEVYTVQLFRSPPANTIVDREQHYQWVFTCKTLRNFNVSSGGITAFASSFNFNTNSSIDYVYDITFYSDSNYQNRINQNRVGYMNQNMVFMRVSVEAPQNVVLFLTSCATRNLASNTITTLINNQCPAEGVSVTYNTPREVNVVFNASFDSPNDMNVSNEFFEVTCVTEHCDILLNSCNTACAMKRKRRSISASKIIHVVSQIYRVRVDHCLTRVSTESRAEHQLSAFIMNSICVIHIDESIAVSFFRFSGEPPLVHQSGCSQDCLQDDLGFAVCSCKEGFALQEDERTCKEIDHPPENFLKTKSLQANLEEVETNKVPQSPPSHNGMLSLPTNTTTTLKPTTTSKTTKAMLKPKTHKFSSRRNKKKLPVSFEAREEIPETDDRNMGEAEESPEGSEGSQSVLFYAIIGLVTMFCVMMMMMIYQQCKPKRKLISFLDSLARSGGEEIR